jgi:hypothetical protein
LASLLNIIPGIAEPVRSEFVPEVAQLSMVTFGALAMRAQLATIAPGCESLTA